VEETLPPNFGEEMALLGQIVSVVPYAPAGSLASSIDRRCPRVFARSTVWLSVIRSSTHTTMSSQGSDLFVSEESSYHTLHELFPLGLQLTQHSPPVPTEATAHRVYVSSNEECFKTGGSGFRFSSPKRKSVAKPGANFIDESNYRKRFDAAYRAVQSSSIIKLVIEGCAPGSVLEDRDDRCSGVPKQLIAKPAGVCPAVLKSVVNGESSSIGDIVAAEGLVLRCMATADTLPEKFGFFEIWLCVASRMASATCLVDFGLHQHYVSMSKGLKAYMLELSQHPFGESQDSQRHRVEARDYLVGLWEEISYGVYLVRVQGFRCEPFRVEFDLDGNSDDVIEVHGGSEPEEIKDEVRAEARPRKKLKREWNANMIGSCLYAECYDKQLAGGFCEHSGADQEVKVAIVEPEEDYSEFWGTKDVRGDDIGGPILIEAGENKQKFFFDDELDNMSAPPKLRANAEAKELWNKIFN
jgi:hypothetical protein